MRIVIVGCGAEGAHLARALSLDGHTVSIIDERPESFEMLGPAFKGRCIEGRAFDRQALLEAAIDRADGFAALTDNDNANLVSVVAARRLFHVPKVVARVLNPQRAALYHRFGIYTISPTAWVASQAKRVLTHAGLTGALTFGSGQVEMVEVAVPPRWAGHPVEQIAQPGEIVVAAIDRGGRAFVPSQATLLEEGDVIYISAVASALGRLEAMLHP